MPLAQTPGPDLAWQDTVMESEAFISGENSCIPTSLRTLRGVGSTSRRPGRAGMQGLNFMAPASLILKRQQIVRITSRSPRRRLYEPEARAGLTQMLKS